MRVSCRFSLVRSSSSDYPIRMRVSYEGQRLDLRTGFVCPPAKWNKGTMRMRPGSENRYGEKAASVNAALSRMESVVAEILTRYELDHKVPVPSVLKADLEQALGRESHGSSSARPSTLLDLVHRFLDEYSKEASWRGRTAHSYATSLERIADYPLGSVAPDELSASDLFAYVSSLWEEGISNMSVSLYLSKLRTALRWGRRVGLYHGDLPETFHPKLKGLGSKVINFLEWDEFKKLLYLPVVNPEHAAVRDAFCFCCCTGLRVSDCSALTWAQVNLTATHPYINVSARKTTRPIVVELNQFSRAILSRQQIGSGASLVFPAVPNRSRNYILPILAKRAGLGRLVREIRFVGATGTEQLVPVHDAISTHWGRHTFVVHALRLGIPPTVIMAWTGHSSMASMKPYIAIADVAKVENMALFDEDPS